MKLRDYQLECIDILKKNDRQLIQLPTGSGKTVIFLKYLRENSNQALITCPTLDLQEQIYQSALNFYHKDEICLKNKDYKFKKSTLTIIVAPSLNSETNREFLKSQKFDHIVIDEAHRALCKTYEDFLEFYSEINPNFKLIGFTATPERLDKKNLLKLFHKLTFERNIYEMIMQGYLCNIESFRIKTKDKITTNSKSNDFKTIELKHLDNYSRNALIYKTYFENCLDKKTLIFCLSVEHAEKIADYLRKEKGISAHHISGKQTIAHRKQIIQEFKSGKIKVLTNCQLLTEGFDEPSIESIIIARPTRSKALYCQMLGRGTRKFPGKTICSLYELTDNCHRICTFNVAADESKENNFIRHYRDGIKLTELRKEIENISLNDFVLEKEKINIISDFSSYLASQGLLDVQKKKLNELSINYMNPINLLQASFLLFIQELKRKYGYNS